MLLCPTFVVEPLCDLEKLTDDVIVNPHPTYKTDPDHKMFISVVVVAVLALVVLYFVIFAVLQYKTNGRCCRGSEDNLYLSSAGEVQYSSLTGNDTDILFNKEDGLSREYKRSANGALGNTNKRNNVLDYESD